MKLKLRSAVRTGLGFDFQSANGSLKVFVLEKKKEALRRNYAKFSKCICAYRAVELDY